jgi:hypothetical protein
MKAKKIILSLLIASPLMFTACSDSDKGGSGRNGNGGVVIPGGQPGNPIQQPNAFFNGLRHSENVLYIKYWFSSQIVGPNITYSDLDKITNNGLTTFQIIARNHRRSVQAVKLSFYDDIYAFAQNLQNLKLRETELRAYNNALYEDYVAKTESLGSLFITKRARIYSRLLELREEKLYGVGIQRINVIRKGVLDINVVGVDYGQISNNRRSRVLIAIKNAKTTCDALNTMMNDVNFGSILVGKDIRECSSSPAVSEVAKLNDVDGLSRDDIARSINKSSVDLIINLNTVADSYLLANSIILNVNSDRGINYRARRDWEHQVNRDNSGIGQRTLQIAIDNNLFENLIFKKRVLETLELIRPHMTHEQRTEIRNSLIAIRKALNGLSHINLDFKVGSSAVSNGAGMTTNPIPRFRTQPDLQPDLRPDLRDDDQGLDRDFSENFDGDDLSEFDDLDQAPRVTPDLPKPKPAPEADKEEVTGPPTPPTTVRRRP